LSPDKHCLEEPVPPVQPLEILIALGLCTAVVLFLCIVAIVVFVIALEQAFLWVKKMFSPTIH
jgi:hypothetical protein